jgi:hypothetical protein
MQSITSTVRQGLRYFWGEVRLVDFSGGLNLRDAAPELATNESPDMWNVTLDERGGIQKRLGFRKWNSSAFGASLVKNTYAWPSGGTVLTQAGANLYLGTSTTSSHTFTTAARVGFADFAGKVWAVHPIDGVYSSPDGSTWSAVAGSPKGSTTIAWQNRLIVGGDPSNPATLYGSGLGDGTDWSTAVGHGWTNQLRDNASSGSGDLVIAVGAASGVDIQGRPGLIVCKRSVTYRVYDSDTGAYQILDNAVGAASSLSVANLFGRTIILSTRGIYWTDGVSQLTPASQKIDPWFTSVQVAIDQPDLWCAGVKGDRVRFSMPRAGETANSVALEYHPLEGWITASSNAASCYTLNQNNAQQLLAGSPSVVGQVWEMDVTGADNGAAIISRFQTRWLEPTAGHPIRMRRLRLSGNGTFNMNIFENYDVSSSQQLEAEITGNAAVYDDAGAVYDNTLSLYGPLKTQDHTDFYSLGVANAVSFQIQETSTLSTTAQPELGGTATAEIGAWSVYSLDLQYVPLGLA